MTGQNVDIGALFQKSDLQVHTARDPMWSGQRPVGIEQTIGIERIRNERDVFAEQFVKAARAKGLSIVGVTDHHEMVLVPHILAAAKRLKGEIGELWVFPGMELTLEDSVQALILFDMESEQALWRRVGGCPKFCVNGFWFNAA